MSTLRLKVEVDPVYITVEKEYYKPAWQEAQEELGEVEEGEDAGEPPDEFVMELVEEEFNEGQRDLSEAFESAGINVTRAR